MGRYAGMLKISEIHAKAHQHCRTEDCFVDDMKWFATGLRSCVVAAVDTTW